MAGEPVGRVLEGRVLEPGEVIPGQKPTADADSGETRTGAGERARGRARARARARAGARAQQAQARRAAAPAPAAPAAGVHTGLHTPDTAVQGVQAGVHTPAAPPVHVHIHLGGPEEKPTGWRRCLSYDWDFAWLLRWARPRQTVLAIPLAIMPGMVWTSIISSCRADAGAWAGYVLALGPLVWLLTADVVNRSYWARVGLLVAAAGVGAAFHWIDILTVLTGVTQ